MSITLSLEGRVALVTGASQGIGAEIARCLHRAGAVVVINHAELPDAGESAQGLAAELCGLRPDSAFAVGADVSKQDAVAGMMREIQSRCGGLDILVNNAGIIRDRTIAKMTMEEWESVLSVNLSGVFLCCKYGLEILRDEGAIVSLGSIAALIGFHGQSNYAAAKGGVLAMTRVLSREAARRGIRVNAIAPGVIETAMAETIPEEVRRGMLEQIPLRRFGRPGEIADAVLFLCSPMASYITGQTLEINGGWRG